MPAPPRLALLFTAAVGCARPAAPQPTDPRPAPEAPKAPGAPAHEPAARHRDAGDLPPPWWTPLPALSLDALGADEIAAAKTCGEPHDLAAPEATAADLLAAARCFGAARAFGKEIALYRRVLAARGNPDESADALRSLGERHEQLDDRPAAIAAYADYLARYPTRQDARAVGERAVCLARSLEDAETVDALLSELSKLYGRRGFVVPPPAALAQLCAGLPAPGR